MMWELCKVGWTLCMGWDMYRDLTCRLLQRVNLVISSTHQDNMVIWPTEEQFWSNDAAPKVRCITCDSDLDLIALSSVYSSPNVKLVMPLLIILEKICILYDFRCEIDFSHLESPNPTRVMLYTLRKVFVIMWLSTPAWGKTYLRKLLLVKCSGFPSGLLFQTRGLFPGKHTHTKSLLMYNYFNTLYPQNLISLYSQHACFPQNLKPNSPSTCTSHVFFPNHKKTP